MITHDGWGVLLFYAKYESLKGEIMELDLVDWGNKKGKYASTTHIAPGSSYNINGTILASIKKRK